MRRVELQLSTERPHPASHGVRSIGLPKRTPAFQKAAEALPSSRTQSELHRLQWSSKPSLVCVPESIDESFHWVHTFSLLS